MVVEKTGLHVGLKQTIILTIIIFLITGIILSVYLDTEPSPNDASNRTIKQNLQLFAYNNYLGVQIPGEERSKIFLWFYEWNMFNAGKPRQHTTGYQKNNVIISDENHTALIQTPQFTLKAKSGIEGVEFTLLVNNTSGYDWPDVAAIIPCLNPGFDKGRYQNPNMVTRRTYYLTEKGLKKLQEREIHFNKEYREQIEEYSNNGKFAWSKKWPTSNLDSIGGLMIRESKDRRFAAGIAWEEFISAQGHNPYQCAHLSVRVGGLKNGESKAIRGKIYLIEGNRNQVLPMYYADFSKNK